MRHTNLLIALFLLGSFCAQAQVTIELANFPRQAAFLDTFISANANGNIAPEHGMDQMWDYSSLTQRSFNTSQHFDEVGNPDFPNAYTSYQQNLRFQSFIIPAFAYSGLDANGFYDVGGEIVGIKYPISSVTGGPNDTLHFTPSMTVFSTRFDFVKFPCTWQTDWAETSTEKTHFELTVAAFGLNKTPGYQQRTITQRRTVVGYGQLIMPTLGGSPSAPMDVLLIKEVRMQSDSFFLGGAPAPAVLLGAFGISQDMRASDSAYYFYRPGFAAPLIRIGLPDASGPISFAYRPQGAMVATGIADALQLKAISISPNPAAKGQSIQFRTDLQLDRGVLQLFDYQGKMINNLIIEASGQGQYQSAIPASLPSGNYFYLMLNQQGELKGKGKLQVP
ncbi:MAG: hypothetical protein R3B47_08315 [Bacteroidia bacterium]